MGTVILSPKSKVIGKVFPKKINRGGKVYHLHALSRTLSEGLREIAVQRIRGFKTAHTKSFVVAVYRRK